MPACRRASSDWSIGNPAELSSYLLSIPVIRKFTFTARLRRSATHSAALAGQH